MARKDKDDKAKKPSFTLKTPKGTRDWSGTDMVIREQIFSTIAEVFKRHGAVTIDTPVFELREILAGKYGEDSKLIYDLADQGGEICSLRYDLTISFARWIAMNPAAVPIRRYQIGKVYRRDQPQMTKGRMREFWQCDFDIAGEHDPMIPDAEILRITTEIFDALGWDGKYTIKLNNRKILDGIFQVCGVPEDKIRSISSAVDKLDKAPWEEVKREMTEEKGLDPSTADKIWSYVQHKGQEDVLQMLAADETLMANASAKKGVEDMLLLASYLNAFQVMPKISIDMSLARGLDYYTGVIYEVVAHAGTLADTSNTDGETSGVGSVAAGGRYDGLVGMFSGREAPCVGISFGVERIFSIMKARLEKDKSQAPIRPRSTDIYVMAFGGKGFTGLLPERMAIARQLWDAGIKAEFAWKQKPKLPAQFKEAESGMIPFAVILGEEELRQGRVRIKEMGLPEGHPDKDGVFVEQSDLVAEVRSRLEALDTQSLSQRFGAINVAGGEVAPASADATSATETSTTT